MKTFLKEKKGVKSFFLVAILVILAILAGSVDQYIASPKTAFKRFETKLNKQRLILKKELTTISAYPSEDLFNINRYNAKSQQGQEIFLFAYYKDRLRFWSNQALEAPAISDTAILKNGFVRLSNGLYMSELLQNEHDTYIALFLVKSFYPYENEYLVSEFNPYFRLPDETQIHWQSTGYDVLDQNLKLAFALKFSDSPGKSKEVSYILFLLYLSAILFIIKGLHIIYRNLVTKIKYKNLLFLAFVFDVIILRAVLMYFRIPQVLYESKLFSPAWLAINEFIPSLGDLVVNSAILLALAWYFFKSRVLFDGRSASNKGKVIVGFTLLLHVYIFFRIFLLLFRSIIFNSIISYDLNNIFSLTTESFLGGIAITTLLLAFFLISAKLISIALSLCPAARKFMGLTIIAALTFMIAELVLKQFQPVYLVIVTGYIFIFWAIQYRVGKEFTFVQIISFIAIFSFISTYTLRTYKIEKEKQERTLLAIELAGERDKVAEFRLQEMFDKIKKDNVLRTLLEKIEIDPNSEKEAIRWITEQYFDKFWQKYDLLVTICYKGKQLQISPSNYVVGCSDYFEKHIETFSEPTSIQGLYYMFPGTGEVSYIAQLKTISEEKHSKSPTTLYLEVNSKSAPKGLGYPELLIDNKSKRLPEMSGYSYAIYLNGKLNKSVGKYPYEQSSLKFDKGQGDFTFFNRGEYSHLLYRANENWDIIVSYPEETFFALIAPFSYVFIFLGLFTILFSVIVRPTLLFSGQVLSFRNRIQYSMFVLIFLSFIVIGFSTLIYLRQLNYEKNRSILSEKSHSVLLEIEQILSNRAQFDDETNEYIQSLLSKFSMIFFSDINLYDTSGYLIATSRSQIFSERLISKYINPEAFKQLSVEKKLSFIHNENIGNYAYLSAYLPLRNNMNELMGYLNLPYFARQGELRQEISMFLIAFTNIYIVLVALGLLLALVLSNYVLHPLSLMKMQLRKIKIGNTNQKIPWRSKDEIGQLIGEYNRMTEELAQSAELLALSERENAWREMAKQVAHEIKNPLTPMKLNIQHLQKAWNEGAPDWDKRLQRFTNTLTQQIDALSEIASAFSDFAALPQGASEKVDLMKIARDVSDLYSDLDNINIEIKPALEYNYFNVVADPKQMLRVFNNLIKNSVQAIGNNPNGQIKIVFTKKNQMVYIVLSDNGGGISPELQEKIFSPYFTTKSSGMGLGLAIVKNIITSIGGSISYDSEKGNGTAFHIYLPVA